MTDLLVIAVCILTGFDGYISYRRMSKYGTIVEVNPFLRQVSEDYGLKVAVAVNILYNFAIATFAWSKHWNLFLSFFAGTKFALALLQIKSLQSESYVEKILSKLQERRVATSKNTESKGTE